MSETVEEAEKRGFLDSLTARQKIGLSSIFGAEGQ